MSELIISKGPYAANVYTEDRFTELCLDWTYDGLYFKCKGSSWITISLGPNTIISEIYKINTDELRLTFKRLSIFMLSELFGYSERSDTSLKELLRVIDYFV